MTVVYISHSNGNDATATRIHFALAGAGIHAIWVHDSLSDGIEPVELVPAHVREEAAKAVSSALDVARQDFGRRAVR